MITAMRQSEQNRDPREIPAYTVGEAAQLVRVPVSTLKTWVATDGLVNLPAGRPRLLAFSHLVETFVLAAIRRGHGVSLQRVRRR
jgi:DNA-binding transcriptional MerR regulator